jgi:hypothetical protein
MGRGGRTDTTQTPARARPLDRMTDEEILGLQLSGTRIDDRRWYAPVLRGPEMTDAIDGRPCRWVVAISKHDGEDRCFAVYREEWREGGKMVPIRTHRESSLGDALARIAERISLSLRDGGRLADPRARTIFTRDDFIAALQDSPR